YLAVIGLESRGYRSGREKRKGSEDCYAGSLRVGGHGCFAEHGKAHTHYQQHTEGLPAEKGRSWVQQVARDEEERDGGDLILWAWVGSCCDGEEDAGGNELCNQMSRQEQHEQQHCRWDRK